MRNRADKKLQTDRRTDGPTDKLTPIYPPNRVLGGIMTREQRILVYAHENGNHHPKFIGNHFRAKPSPLIK